MTKLGWCLSYGTHSECWGVVRDNRDRTGNTLIPCDCKHHEGETFVSTKDGQRAVVSRPTADQKASGEVPEYADLLLEVSSVNGGMNFDEEPIVLTWAGANAARDALAQVLHEHAGKSIVERLETDLDSVFDRLMDDPPEAQKLIDQGWARGLATAIAYMRGVDMDIVREQAMERWEDRHGDDEE